MNSNQIKPIETEYKGYLFRSRLEARWAIFFDMCGADWEYEAEGYNLGEGLYYLPDFVIHNVPGRLDLNEENKDLYIEVKGKMTDIDAKKINKFSEFKPILVVGDIPKGDNFDDIIDDIYEKHSFSNKFGYLSEFSFETIDFDNYTAFPCINSNGELEIFGGDYFEYDSCYNKPVDKEKTVEAYKLARQSRFEHKNNEET